MNGLIDFDFDSTTNRNIQESAMTYIYQEQRRIKENKDPLIRLPLTLITLNRNLKTLIRYPPSNHY